MKTVYLDATAMWEKFGHVVGVMVKDAEVIRAGAVVSMMPLRDKNERAHELAEKYDIHFIFEDDVPMLDFYTIPMLEIVATDSSGGFLGGSDDVDDGQVFYIDKDKQCFAVAESIAALLAEPNDWREKMTPCETVMVFASKDEAMKEREFIDLSPLLAEEMEAEPNLDRK